jgi:hypothetical protein
MKRTIIMFVLAALVIISLLMWALNSQMKGNIQEILMVAIAMIVVGFGVYMAIRRVKSTARKEPLEDELSRKIMLRSSSLSYFISIYWWLFLMYMSNRITWPMHMLIGVGILGMAVIFVLSWLWTKFFGMRYE